MLKSAVVCLALCSTALAAISLAPLDPKPEKYKDEQGCYISELDMMVPFGQSKPSKENCMEYRCGEDYVSHVTCGVAVALPPCTTVKHKDKPYPDCCPRFDCPDANGSNPDTE